MKSNMKSTVSVLHHNLCLLNCVVWRSRADNILLSFALNSLWSTTPLFPTFSCFCRTFNKTFLFYFLRCVYASVLFHAQLSLHSMLSVYIVCNDFNMEIIAIIFFSCSIRFSFLYLYQILLFILFGEGFMPVASGLLWWIYFRLWTNRMGHRFASLNSKINYYFPIFIDFGFSFPYIVQL